jgi:hypothetical protein
MQPLHACKNRKRLSLVVDGAVDGLEAADLVAEAGGFLEFKVLGRFQHVLAELRLHALIEAGD